MAVPLDAPSKVLSKSSSACEISLNADERWKLTRDYDNYETNIMLHGIFISSY